VPKQRNTAEEGEEDNSEAYLASLADIAGTVQEFVEADHDALGPLYPGIHSHVGSLRERGIKLSFADIGPDAAFVMQDDGRQMIFSNQAAMALAEVVSSQSEIAKEDRPSFFRSLIILFILHEARHVTQGLSAHADARALKDIGQGDVIALYDLIADIDAAKAFAAFQCYAAESFTPEAFETHFVEALTLNVFYCLPAFGFPYEKPAKMGRAIGLVLMLARAGLLQFVSKSGIAGPQLRPLTEGIFVRSDEGYKSASVQWTEGACSIVTVERAPADQWVRRMAKAVAAGNMGEALRIGSTFMMSRVEFWGR
jgi:hypothetical protein